MPRVIVFDVNETLLDLKALDAHFDRVFRAPGVRKEWFKQVLQWTETCADAGARADRSRSPAA